ncbi:MAG: CPBP family intramembrane metalloprotease [Verrucomicrobia bacterium]|nr:CPBP family intramembrane metalloprotease [Verrucomicrobiota bacterium]
MVDLHLTARKKKFLLLWILCIAGSWAVLPYVQHLGILPAAVSSLELFLLVTAQSSLLFGIVCWLCYVILPKTDLRPFPVHNFLKQVVYPALIAGVALGVAIFFFDKTLFHSSLLSGAHPPFWTGALASIYGAVNEEVLMRLFLLTLIYFLIFKWFKVSRAKRVPVLWTATVLAALIFGLGHLPAALKLAAPSSFEVFRVLFLNGIAGVVFGWLYWSRGLWSAMAAHLVTDLVIHVVLI